jgi:TIR domain
MSVETRCPGCGSEDVHYRAKRGDWICFDCDHSWSGGAPAGTAVANTAAVSVAVFVSYGHADSSDFASRLKTDLETRGVTPVWLDTEMIAGGNRWVNLIEQGIRGSDVLLAVMTAHSLCEQSICQDEIAFAVAEGKRVVPVRVDSDPALRPSLLLVRRSWVDFSQDYESALARLLSALNCEEGALSAPTIALVSGLVPLDFSPEIARHVDGFVGREWLFSELDSWLANSKCRAFVVVGEPGAGKSAIAAKLSLRGDAISAHFCSTANSRTLDPREFVANLVAQLVSRVDGFERLVLARHPELRREHASVAFRELIVEPARAVNPPEEPQLVIVDALDEAATREGETIVELIATHAPSLPAWLRIIATSRPEATVMNALKSLCPVELPAERAENRQDIADYLAKRLAAAPETATSEEDRGEAVAQLAERAAGNFLYARMATDALEQGVLRVGDIGSLPPGLDGFFSATVAKAFPDPETYLRDYGPVLRPLATAFAPLSMDVLCVVSGLDRSTLNLRLNHLRSYLKVAGGRGDAVYSFFHRALSEWLVDRSKLKFLSKVARF